MGEIWFDTPPSMSTVLAKYLFTGEHLSVQVHPTADFSPAQSGKDECWLVTDAKEGARLAVGFREEFSAEMIRAAALDGSIENMLAWREVADNDFIYVPAGTVHSMGPGLTVVEIQQNTDITYRLYDYGRPRVLHLEEAMASILTGPHPPELRTRIDPGRELLLVDGPHFFLAQCIGKPSDGLAARLEGAVQFLPLAGQCCIGDIVVAAGGSAWVGSLYEIEFDLSERCLLVASPRPRDLKSTRS
ncbi:class I mannose-6-phosphate isomerase [Erythrobacter sp. SD-21]|uniref:class I mannose-6-phosphate isomerase n=1 Tax=Erythrobacter sp. SD-21 TaxID=161528 RepID=UPI0012EA84E6|nr:class I mannose-6-phosphate isomerase [Erythrobacter sp. SD-21]